MGCFSFAELYEGYSYDDGAATRQLGTSLGMLTFVTTIEACADEVVKQTSQTTFFGVGDGDWPGDGSSEWRGDLPRGDDDGSCVLIDVVMDQDSFLFSEANMQVTILPPTIHPHPGRTDI